MSIFNRFELAKLNEKSGIAPWPKHWPEYHNANIDRCDAAIGPCACGATHDNYEFYFDNKTQTLFRYDEPV